MTGRSGQVGATGARGVAAVAVTLALTLLSAVGVATLGSDTAGAPTVLARGEAVSLQLPDGAVRAGRAGEELPRGTVVTAGPDGAVLATRGREVHLGSATTVQVLDGERQALRAGLVMVDATGAPGLRLDTPAASVTTPDGALTRVERGALLRVGSFRGDAAAVRAADRQATTDVPALHQVQVPDGGLPGRVVPLALTGDRYEQLLARDLVMADDDLAAVARTLDTIGGTSAAVLRVADASVDPAAPAPALPAAARASERGLSYLLAAASEGDDRPLPARYAAVLGLRLDGGSWGVVAALVAAPVSGVGAQLDALLAPPPALASSSTPVDLGALLAPPPPPPPVLVAEAPGLPAAPTPAPAAPRAPAPAAPAPPGPATPVPPAPAPVPGLLDPVTGTVGEVVDVVGSVVDSVLGLLTPPAPASTSPTPSPTPTPTRSSLLDLPLLR